MLDFDGSKFIIIGIVALLVIGPKDLPRLLRQIGQWTGKLRRMASEFQGQFMDAMREADLDSIKKEVKGVADVARVDTHFDPIGDIRREIGSIKTDLRSSLSTSPTGEPTEPGAAAAPAGSGKAIASADSLIGAHSTAAEPLIVVPDPPALKVSSVPRNGIGSLPTSLPSLGSKSTPS